MAATVAKGYHLVSTYGLRFSDFDALGWLQLGACAIEAVCAIWLLSGLARTACLYMTLSLFTVFTGTTLFQYLLGRDSCNCFGAFSIPPVVMLYLDLTVLMAVFVLLHRKPRQQRRPLAELKEYPFALTGLITGFIAFGIILVLSYQYGSIAAAVAAWKGCAITVNPAIRNLGRLNASQRITTTIEVVNLGNSSARIVGARTGCSCMIPSIRFPYEIQTAGQSSIPLEIVLPAEESAFRKDVTLFVSSGGNVWPIRCSFVCTIKSAK